MKDVHTEDRKWSREEVTQLLALQIVECAWGSKFGKTKSVGLTPIIKFK